MSFRKTNDDDHTIIATTTTAAAVVMQRPRDAVYVDIIPVAGLTTGGMCGTQKQHRGGGMCSSSNDNMGLQSFGVPLSSTAGSPMSMSSMRAHWYRDDETGSISRIVLPGPVPDAVCVAFFEHGSIPIWNITNWMIQRRLVCVSPIYEHCQIVFAWTSKTPGEDDVTMTFSTTKRTPSTYLSPSYRANNWSALTIPGARKEDTDDRNIMMKKAMLKWSEQHEDIPFNNYGFYFNFLPCVGCCPSLAYDAEGTSYFCAEQVAAFLKECGVVGFEDIMPHVCTPDAIYNILEAKDARVKMLRVPRLLLRTKQAKRYEKFSPHQRELLPPDADNFREWKKINVSNEGDTLQRPGGGFETRDFRLKYRDDDDGTKTT